MIQLQLKPVDYRIVTAFIQFSGPTAQVGAFQSLVNELLSQGYVPHGPTDVQVLRDGLVYTQPMLMLKPMPVEVPNPPQAPGGNILVPRP